MRKIRRVFAPTCRRGVVTTLPSGRFLALSVDGAAQLTFTALSGVPVKLLLVP